MKKEKNHHLDILKLKINKFLSNDKPADVLIIKAHLICEYYLNQILIFEEKCAPQKINRTSFYEKLNLAISNDSNCWDRNVKQSLKILNKLRNKVGHELEFKLSESDIDDIGYITLGKKIIIMRYSGKNDYELLHDILITIAIDCAILVKNAISTEEENLEQLD